ncbi:MAG: phenylalanine--tRNA ligase subunit beta, partial [Patescibacteria group bacterium]
MYLSLNWLKDFVDIPKEVSALELGKKLTMHTVEVEKVEAQAEKYKNVIVGKILEVKPHPNADRLRLALVDIGKEKLEIVCGAPNIKPDQLVPVALVGAILPNGLEIKPAEIRGVKSNGMLCAEDELDLGFDHNGILILDKAKAGQNFSDYLNLNDVVFEVDNKSITHRADLWSHYGMARDISAFLNSKFKTYQPKAGTLKAKKTTFKFDVKIENFSLCPRYMGIGVEGIKIAPSPKWM